MKYLADFHIHSHYSLATSKQLAPEYLEMWAYLKGLRVVGTGDFTHPGWLKELKEKLSPADPGLYKLNDARRITRPLTFSPFAQADVRFVLSAEISNIYKRGGKTRKVHNVVLVPDLEAAEKIQTAIVRFGGNIKSDGRPILGMDSQDLLDLCLNASPDVIFIPAHIWTPWFSVLGSKSGFDDLKQCYGDLVRYIHAVETGLSSDAPMNWACSFLDKFMLVANSDAHSPDKLGRNANIFNTELSYFSIAQALKSHDPQVCGGTIHLFPQEGKYHFDGHRKCGVCWDPVQTLTNREVCPVCGKPVVVGVLNRVAELSDRKDILLRPERLPFVSIVPLPEIIAEIEGVSSASKKVASIYQTMIQKFGPELGILLETDTDVLRSGDYPLLGEAVERMRQRRVLISEGYDGEYGNIRLFGNGEIAELRDPSRLFMNKSRNRTTIDPRPLLPFDLGIYQKKRETMDFGHDHPGVQEDTRDSIRNVPDIFFSGLNPEQIKAVTHFDGPCLVLAGPGTGKTKTLVARIEGLIMSKNIPASQICALTFTNKAALEMRQRLMKLIPDQEVASQLRVYTFHSLGLTVLKKYADVFGRKTPFQIIDDKDREHILVHHLQFDKKAAAEMIERIHEFKSGRLSECAVDAYERLLQEFNLFDLDDLVRLPLKLVKTNPEICKVLRSDCAHLLIDEYQDIDAAQYELVRHLMPEEGSNIYAIGDPNQSIYGFRGADVQYIKRFMADYPKAKVITFRESYRCSDKILKASAGVVGSENEATCLRGLKDGLRIKIAGQSTDKSEAEYIACTIERMMGGVRFFSMDSDVSRGEQSAGITSFADFAVLCRSRSLMPLIEKAFHDHAIPYRAYATNKFFSDEPARTLLDIIKYVRQPENYFLTEKLKARDLLSLINDKKTSFDTCRENTGEMIQWAWTLIRSRYESPQYHANLEKMLAIALDFDLDMDGFIEYTGLGSDRDTIRADSELVNLMTIHAAKGLEFECVFIAGCEDGIIPLQYKGDDSDIEEERRLLYVGMTRAKRYLVLTHAQKRMKYGVVQPAFISPFVNDIQKDLINREKQAPAKKADPERDQIKLF